MISRDMVNDTCSRWARRAGLLGVLALLLTVGMLASVITGFIAGIIVLGGATSVVCAAGILCWRAHERAL